MLSEDETNLGGQSKTTERLGFYLHNSFEIAENKVVRTALSKTIARPSLEQLDSNVSVGAFDSRYPLTISSGNPNLQPYESVNLDLAYEHYYAEGSYFAVNYFRKDKC